MVENNNKDDMQRFLKNGTNMKWYFSNRISQHIVRKPVLFCLYLFERIITRHIISFAHDKVQSFTYLKILTLNVQNTYILSYQISNDNQRESIHSSLQPYKILGNNSL